MSDPVESIADEYRRRAYREVVVGVAGVIAAALLALALFGTVGASAVVLASAVVAYAPLFEGQQRLELRSDDPPSTVRSRFAGRDCPLVALERAWSDEVDETDDGWEFSYVGGGIFRRDVEYESVRTDDGLRVTVFRNDALRVTYEVTVSEDTATGGSRVSVVGRWGSRRHLRSVLLDRVRESRERRVYEALGYEVLALRTERSLPGIRA